MGSVQAKLLAVIVGVAAVGTLIGFYVVGFLMSGPATYAPPARPGRPVSLTLETVAAVGPGSPANPDWVSYYVRDAQHRWLHTTNWALPAHTLVIVTLYQFDTATGLRNPFMAEVRGTTGNTMRLNGKELRVIDPNDTSHTFAVPALGLIVPLKGVADNAKNQCAAGPCGLRQAHNTIRFSFRTPGPGVYRWQCFVPCAAGFLFGFGGPMQTIGYMDGFLNVS